MDQEHTLTFGPFRLETSSGRLWRQDDGITLRPRSFAMLLYLAEHPGRLVTKAEVIQQVWAGAHVSDDVLRASVRDIRRALDDDATAPQYLETVGRQGYRFLQARDNLRLQASGPLVGRQREVDQLLDRFGRAASGERQFVLLSGEPGIGKTTLVNLFLDRLAERDGVRVAHGQCIVQYGEGEAYQPMLEALGRLALEPGGPSVLSVLQRYAPMWLVQLPALVNGAELERLQRHVQGATQARMRRELCEALEAITAEAPLMLVFEDLHWSDVSTVELLAAIAQRRDPAQLFVLGTYRPVDATVHAQPLRHVIQELRGRGQCEELALELLSPEDVTAYVTGRLGGSVSATLNQLISRRSEGNPLFVVNLIDHLLQQKALIQPDGQWMVNPERQALLATIPEGLRPLIMRRLETLSSEEYRALEVASVAGMAYATAAVAAALQQGVDEVEAVYESLATKGHFIEGRELSEWPDGTLSGRYRFQHPLYHQVLYEQVGLARRAQVHLRLGNRLEAGYGDRAHEIAVELAIHFEQGRDVGRAVQYLQVAGSIAQKRSAHQEAIGHLRQGLTTLQSLPDDFERSRHELVLLTTLGSVLMNTQGWVDPEVEDIYMRAQALCHQIGDTDQLFAAIVGLWGSSMVRGELQTADERAQELFTLAEHCQEPALQVEACWMQGSTAYFQGAFGAARTHLAQGRALYTTHDLHPFFFHHSGGSPVNLFPAYQALVLWMLGYPARALEQSQEALRRAHELGHDYGLVFVQLWAATLHQFRREVSLTAEHAQAAIRLSIDEGFTLLSTYGPILHGWTQAQLGQGNLVQMQQDVAAYEATGSAHLQPYFLTLLAEMYGGCAQVSNGLEVLKEGLCSMKPEGSFWWAAETHRLKGELLLASSSDNPAEPEVCFHRALDMARQQQAKSLELRAATSLAKLWQSQDEHQDAYDLLAPIYNWFTEGFDTADLQDAKALLSELER